MNSIMKQLTAYSIILLVPTLVAGVFGMNFDDLPKQHGFWTSMGQWTRLLWGWGFILRSGAGCKLVVIQVR
jgi:Mg2+ and Co2+ transporter CorA